MTRQPLIKTNPYLRDSKRYKTLLMANVLSSTAIELVKIKSALVHALKGNKTRRLIKRPRGSSSS